MGLAKKKNPLSLTLGSGVGPVILNFASTSEDAGQNQFKVRCDAEKDSARANHIGEAGAEQGRTMPRKQGCRAVKIFNVSGSGSGSQKAFRFWIRLQVKRPECFGSGSCSDQHVPAPAPAPHILNIDPLKSIKVDPLQTKNPAH